MYDVKWYWGKKIIYPAFHDHEFMTNDNDKCRKGWVDYTGYLNGFIVGKCLI